MSVQSVTLKSGLGRKVAGLLVLLICILFGTVIGYTRCSCHALLEENVIHYGIMEQNISISSIAWKEYPAWREVTFSINGTVSFRTEKGGDITFENLTNPDAFAETGREHFVSTDGKDVLYYDIVAYYFDNGAVRANIPRIYNENLISATVSNSYYLTFSGNGEEYTAGSISMLHTEYTQWTEDEIKYAHMNLDAYLPAFRLSGTYDAVKPLHPKKPKQEISLEKKEGNALSCTIHNDSNQSWDYENQFPHIELWYKGIWIELLSPDAYNLMMETIEPNKSRAFDIPDKKLDRYPTLINGVYRLVIYGKNGEFIESGAFPYGSSV